ncbi:unnamed protein product [Ixodes hexagonus]
MQIALFAALAPVTAIGHIKSPLRRLVPFADSLKARPPCYQLENVEVPVAIFWGDGDWFSTSRDLDNLRNRLRHVVYDHRVDLNNFNHIDFIYATGAKSLLYDQVVELFRKFEISKVPK